MLHEIWTDLQVGGARFEVEIRFELEWDSFKVHEVWIIGIYADFYGDRGDYVSLPRIEAVLGEMSPVDREAVNEALKYALENEHKNPL